MTRPAPRGARCRPGEGEVLWPCASQPVELVEGVDQVRMGRGQLRLAERQGALEHGHCLVVPPLPSVLNDAKSKIENDLLPKLDSVSPPADWMVESEEKVALHESLEQLAFLISLLLEP